MMRASSFLHRSPLLFLALALLALAVFFAQDSPPAQASSHVLVSNMGQTPAISNFDLNTGPFSVAQRFATGSQTGGYTLGSIEVVIRNAPNSAQRDTIRAELWSAATGGGPASKLTNGDLTVPAHPIAAGTVKFTAPANTTLAASTNFFLVIYTTGDFNLPITTTATGDEDSGGATGWSINNKYHFSENVPTGDSNWAVPSGLGTPMRIRVNGPEAAATDPLDLSDLTAKGSPEGGSFSTLTGAAALAPAFDAATTGYRATVGNDTTQLSLEGLTAADSGSTVTMSRNGTSVLIILGKAEIQELDVGDNEFVVRVTDSDSNTRDYTVTVRRVPSGTVWWATLTPGTIPDASIRHGGVGCITKAECDSQLSHNTVSAGGETYHFTRVADLNNQNQFSVVVNSDATNLDPLVALKFCVGDTAYSPKNAIIIVDPLDNDVGWTAGVPVSLSIGTTCAQGTASTNANLSGLTASSSDSATGTFSPLTLTPSTFDADTTSYTATVANDQTHAKLTPTVEDTGKAMVFVDTTEVTDGTASAAISLDVGTNAIDVLVWAEDTTVTKTYTVTITRQGTTPTAPAAPTNLSAASGNGSLSVTWTAPAGTVTGYDVEYKVTTASTYTDASHTGTGTSITISGLTNGTTYDVRVRGVNSIGPGAWATTTGTPAAAPATPTVSLGAFPTTVNEGSSVTVTALLTSALTSDVSIPLTITDETAESTDHGTLASITINATEITGTGTITTSHDADEDHETFTVSLDTANLPSGVAAGSPSLVRITIRDDEARTPAAVTGLNVQPTYARLDLTWTAPAGDVTRYEVHYTTNQTVAGDAALHAGRYPSSGWVDAWYDHSGRGTTLAIHDLPPTPHRVRVRALNDNGPGPWLTGTGTPMERAVTVSLSASPNPVLEGRDVTVTATLKIGDLPTFLQHDVFIPMWTQRHTSEQGDHGWVNGLTIEKHRSSATAVIPTHRDGDGADELFSVHIGSARLQPPVRLKEGAGSVQVWIAERQPPSVSLSASPERVPEGDEVTVTARLSSPLSSDLRVPVAVTRVTSEEEDHGDLRSITIPRGRTTGTGTIATHQDSDGDDERFTLTLGSVWLRATAGSPASVDIVISEVSTADVVPEPSGPLWVWPNPAVEGKTLTLTTTLDEPAPAGGREVEFWVSRGNSSPADAGDFTLSPSSGDGSTVIMDRTPRIRIAEGQLTATATLRIVADGTAEGDETLWVGVNKYLTGSTLSHQRKLTIQDPDGGQSSPGDGGGPGAVGQGKYADLIARMKEWRNDPCCVDNRTYTDLWDRALKAFGETVDDGALEPMTAAEAQGYADRGGERWVEVAAALWELQNRAPTVSAAIADVTGLEAGATQHVSLAGVFHDADGDSLTVSALSSDEAVATVSVAAGYSTLTVTGVSQGAATVTVTAEDAHGERASDDFEVEVAGKYAALIAQMYQWRNDPQWVSYKAHTDRWDRALMAFGETVADDDLTPMTAAEAQEFADKGWERWVEVAEALRELQNRAPTVSAALGDVAIVNEAGTHQVSLSGVFSDPDGDALTISATSGNEAVATVSVAADSSGLTVNAQARGTATVTVTAEDAYGATVEDSFTVMVKAAPVVASAISDVSGLEEGASRDVSLSGAFRDADGDTLTISATSSNDAVATVPVAADHSALTITGVAEGAATVTVTAADSDGNTVSDTFDVSVVAPQQQAPPNQAPTVSSAIADSTIVNESGTRQVSLSGVFDDADGDVLTVTAGSGDDAIATVSVASDGSSLTVSAQARGTATITVTATDGNGGTVDDSFTVTVKAAPVVASAIADIPGLEEGASRDISLSGVFSDADGDTLTVTAASSNDAVVSAFLFQGELSIFALAEGTAAITVTAEDSDGNTVSDAFDVEVVAAPQQQQQGDPNQAPTVSSAIADAIIVHESGTHQVSLSGVFSDGDNDALSITAASSGEAVATVVVAADYSSLTVTARSRGTATVTVTASDGNGGTVEDAFTVTVKAAPVVASPIADVSGLEEGATQDISLSGVFSDADGDALTITAASSDDAIATATVASDGSKLTLTGVAEGTATITVTAQDSDGNRVRDSFAVSVEPEEKEDTSDGPPTVVSPLPDLGLEVLKARLISLAGVFADPDGQELTFSVESSDYGVVRAWMSGDSHLALLGMGEGTATITVTAEDPDGNTVRDQFEVTVRPAS